MEKIKKGDIVGRISYGKDILFRVDRIIKTSNNKKIAILKGIITRVKADSPVEDLEIINKRIIEQKVKTYEERIQKFLKKYLGTIENNKNEKRISKLLYTGKILHLDGDRRYSEKSEKYYKKIGLNAIVKNITESRQPSSIKILLQKYNPDILVITGHDGMIKNGTKFQDIYNYRNSVYFIKSVREARKFYENQKDLVIFAGACQSFYEAIIEAGANFASSPARILIDFLDPLVVAQTIAITEENKFITINDIEKNLRDGIKGVNGIGAMGKKKMIVI